MSLTRDITIQQGDTVQLVIPIFDADNPDNDFYGLSGVDIEATVADDFDADGDPIHDPDDEDIEIVEFGDLALDPERFDVSDVPTIDEGFFDIDDDQDVVVITMPAAATETFVATVGDAEPLVYQVRVIDDDDVLTTVKGQIEVEPSAPFGGGSS